MVVARCVAERAISPLRVGDEVEVVGMVPQINKPKLLKQQIYGWAKFDLPRQRVLRAACIS